MDLAGGTLDIWPVWLLVPRATTVNVAINLRARATVAPASRFRVVNRQRGLDLAAESAESLFDHPWAALAGRLIAFFDPPHPVAVRYATAAPPGSGLGGSSALGMALAGALNEVCGAGWAVPELIRIVVDTEVRILRVATGAQDQYAAALGGARAHHWESPVPRSEPLSWHEDDGGDPLVERFVLVFTREAHSSAEPNGRVLERIFAGHPAATRGVETIAEAAAGMREAILARDWIRVAAFLDHEWAGRQALSEAVTTRTLRRFEAVLRAAGAGAVKACGAGGGGTIVAVAPPESRAAVIAAAREAGGEVLDARSDPEGLRRETSPVR